MNTVHPLPLSVTGLAKRYAGGAGVADISFTVPQGSITGFIGVNGAGKSTTLRCIIGLARPDAGEIRIFGAAPSRKANRRIGFLPEERGLAPRERARDVIAFHGRLRGMSRRHAYDEAERLLERIGLGQRSAARIGELSKGNAQRVQILCALAHRPDLLVLDEPLSGLDPIGQSEVLSLFAEYAANGGSVLYSTHAMAAAERQCDRIVMLSDGRTAFEGAVSEAAERAPHGAIVVTADGERLIAAARALGGETRLIASALGGAARWQVCLPNAVTMPVLTRVLSQYEVPVAALEPIKADLEGAFWNIAASPLAKAA